MGKKIGFGIGYFFLFVFFLVLFFYWTFPYQLLSFKISDMVAQNSSIKLEIKNLSPFFFTQIDLEDVQISHRLQPDKVLTLDSVSVDLSTLSLLTGNINATVNIKQKKGKLKLTVKGSIGGAPNSALPITLEDIEGKIENFTLDQASVIGLAMVKESVASDPATGALLEPILRNLMLMGDLNSNIAIHIEPQFDKTHGQVQVSFNQLSLDIGNEELGIPKQEFSKAHVIIKAENGNMKISDDSMLQATDLSIQPAGRMVMKSNALASMLDVNFGIKLQGKVKSSLELVLTSILGLQQSADGTISFKVSGSLGNPQF